MHVHLPVLCAAFRGPVTSYYRFAMSSFSWGGGCCRPPWLSCAFLGDRMDTQGVPVPSAGHPIHCADMCRLSWPLYLILSLETWDFPRLPPEGAPRLVGVFRTLGPGGRLGSKQSWRCLHLCSPVHGPLPVSVPDGWYLKPLLEVSSCCRNQGTHALQSLHSGIYISSFFVLNSSCPLPLCAT